MITFKNVSKRYPNGYVALNNINLSINVGEMVFLTGHSGAGKSTLLKSIAAIERPTSGTITISGQNIAQLKSSAIPFYAAKLASYFRITNYFLIVAFLITFYYRYKLAILILKP